MKVTGVICEYNPFHPGHLYHLQQIRERQGAESGILCVISGDFVQRGEAAIFSKFARAEAAVAAGADLVIELPLPWCLSSAEGFARGGVGLLRGAGVVDAISFGCESNDAENLSALAEKLLQPETEERTCTILKKGNISYAAARQKALEELAGKDAAALLQTPNNILAVEYIKAAKALGWAPEYLPVLRCGSEHDEAGSASDIRARWESGEDVSALIPADAWNVYQKEIEEGRGPVFSDALRVPALSRLRRLSPEDYAELPDAGEGLENRLRSAVEKTASLCAAAELAKSKRYALSRLRRMLCCAVLDVRKGDASGIPPYIRPLTMNGRGQAILRQMRSKAELPVIQKSAQLRECSESCRRIFAQTAAAHDFYSLAYGNPEQQISGTDYTFTPVRK